MYKKLFIVIGLIFSQTSHAQSALIKTSMGDITIELNTQSAPISSQNFIQYAKKGQYNGTIFHRVINNFMIQGGGFDTQMREKTTNAPITNEADNGLKNDAYTIAMARTGAPHSASAQFFINVKNNDFLNYTSKTQQGWGYAVFGKVTKGFEVVDKIKAVATQSIGYFDNVPSKPIVINNVSIVP